MDNATTPMTSATADDDGQPYVMEADEEAAFVACVTEAMAELDAGIYVSGAEMETWARSLLTPDAVPLPPIRQRAKR
jgi:hypothetical protein